MLSSRENFYLPFFRYLEAGYDYVNIDDCWSELERDESGKIVADKKRFPRGLKFLSDYVSEAARGL
jgi:Alpha galactosidase A